MDKNEPGIDVGTKCGHPCIRLDGRIKNDFGCCICMGETQLCTVVRKEKTLGRSRWGEGRKCKHTWKQKKIKV